MVRKTPFRFECSSQLNPILFTVDENLDGGEPKPVFTEGLSLYGPWTTDNVRYRLERERFIINQQTVSVMVVISPLFLTDTYQSDNSVCGVFLAKYFVNSFDPSQEHLGQRR